MKYGTPRRNKRRIRYGRMIAFLLFNFVFAAACCPFILFYGPFEALKVVAVGSVLTSRHPQFVQAFLSDAAISEITQRANGAVSGSDVSVQHVNAEAGITIDDIQGSGFKGKVMLIEDPKRLKVAVTKNMGISGEMLSTLVKDAGAIAGINGGGFYDPGGGRGNGAYPDGITVRNGEIVYNNIIGKETDYVLIGFDNEGQLIFGEATEEEVRKNNIQEAISFWPVLIKDGKRCQVNDGQWGIAPRTGIGQKADGTVIFVVIDGRQPLWSTGAWMSDLYNIFQKYDAVNAVNLDGGSSSEMIYNGKIITKPCDIFGERYVPSAFVVAPVSRS